MEAGAIYCIPHAQCALESSDAQKKVARNLMQWADEPESETLGVVVGI